MFNIHDLVKVATATIGALVFTTVAVGAAVGPAHLVETAPVQLLAQNGAQISSQANG
jgi:hypothetical protein